MPSSVRGFLTLVRSSYWFVPSAMVLAAFVLATLMLWADGYVDPSVVRSFGPLAVAEAEGARAVLTTIAGSIIGVAGVTFSITIVAVSFASGNYGPRLISNFMRDRGNQVTLGVFVGTFVYSVLILGQVRQGTEGADYDSFVPLLSVQLALLLTILSIGMLIYFFHHVPESIDIQHLTMQIGTQLRSAVQDIYPNDYDGTDELDEPPERGVRIGCISACRAGYMRALDLQHLEKLAEEHDVIIDLAYRPGDFISEEDRLCDIRSAHQRELPEGAADAIRDALSMGRQRTPQQNFLFLVDILVEIAARALSPGINDPQTAMSCFDWLRAGANAFGSREVSDSENTRILSDPITFDMFVERAFGRVRPYAASDRNAALHLMTTLAECAALLPDHSQRRRRLVRELNILKDETLACGADAPWVADVERRHGQLLEVLADPKKAEMLRRSADRFGGRA